MHEYSLENKMDDNQRLTGLGRILRKYSIDEFPQLLNIIIGDMSFIGPRPLLKEYLPFYTDRELLRFKVKPGISGLSQISGRSFVTWDDQFEIDARYSEDISFYCDFLIFLRSIPKVLISADMMITGRIDKYNFMIHRMKQIEEGIIKEDELNKKFNQDDHN